jgi:hypothetical protein
MLVSHERGPRKAIYFLHSGLNFFCGRRAMTGCLSFLFAVGAMHEKDGTGHGVDVSGWAVHIARFSLLLGAWQMTILRCVITT